MRYAQLLLYGPRDLRWVESELAPPGPGEVWLKTFAGAVSVGTEGPLYRGDARSVGAPIYPLMTGYESLAQVIRTGEAVDVRVGERVVSTYGHRTAARVSAVNLMRVPEDVPDEIALLAILANDSSKGVGKLRLKAGDAVLITGAGTIGLLALYRLRWLGFQVDVVEPDPKRRALALTLGARAVFSPDELDGDYAAGVECSSRQTAFAVLQRHLKLSGQVCILADGNIEPLTLTPEFHARELSVVASSAGEDYPGYAEAFFAYWRGTRAPLDKLFTVRITADELPETFEQLAVTRPIKVFVDYR